MKPGQLVFWLTFVAVVIATAAFIVIVGAQVA